MHGFWFKSTHFAIEPGEDADTNPRIYGRQLAAWLKERLAQRGYEVEPVIAEDWGRCLVCSRTPFLLWVGCANTTVLSDAPHPPRDASELIWHCFVQAEVPFWRSVLRKVDTSAAVARLAADLIAILGSEPHIVLVSEP